MYCKYRGKLIETDTWVEGLPYENSFKTGVTEIISKQNGIKTVYRVRPETVGQSINYRDHAGTEIFTGDVVQFGDQHKYLVWFCNEMQCLEAICLDDLENVSEIRAIAQYIETEPTVSNKYDYHNYENSTGCISHWEKFCEMLQDPCGTFDNICVIGNIFDNPEFIEGAYLV